MTMTVHDNGVVSDYDYDYQDFSVHGQLAGHSGLAAPALLIAIPQFACNVTGNFTKNVAFYLLFSENRAY